MMELKMSETFEINSKVVTCHTCDYTFWGPHKRCKTLAHRLTWKDCKKHFWECSATNWIKSYKMIFFALDHFVLMKILYSRNFFINFRLKELLNNLVCGSSYYFSIKQLLRFQPQKSADDSKEKSQMKSNKRIVPQDHKDFAEEVARLKKERILLGCRRRNNRSQNFFVFVDVFIQL